MVRRERLAIVVFTACVSLAHAAGPQAQADQYVVDYPTAEQFAPPVASYFDDTTQTIQKVGSRTFRHQPNGGYGLPVVMKVDAKNLVHLGSDVAWYRSGEPVYAIAAGVVRASQGPPPLTAGENPPKKSGDKSGANPGAAPMEWGNLIVIEHHLDDGSYVTSVYGHLSSDRLVAAGDVVQAGQMIGSIGKAGRENGGYKPHLHFGLREGRMFEPGCPIMTLFLSGKPTPIILVDFKETEVELSADATLPTPLHVQSATHPFTITERDGKLWMPTAALNHISRPDFPITGYSLSTKGWHDPTTFLLAMLNKFPRAPYGAAPDPAVVKTAAEQRHSPQVALVTKSAAEIVVERLKKARRPKLYNPKAVGESQVKLALVRANKTDKRVLLVYGGNWCEWCYRLHDALTEHDDLRGYVRRNYELVMIDVDTEANKKLAADYKAEISQYGVPYLTVLNADGEVLSNQEVKSYQDGATHDPAKLLAFLQEHAARKAASR